MNEDNENVLMAELSDGRDVSRYETLSRLLLVEIAGFGQGAVDAATRVLREQAVSFGLHPLDAAYVDAAAKEAAAFCPTPPPVQVLSPTLPVLQIMPAAVRPASTAPPVVRHAENAVYPQVPLPPPLVRQRLLDGVEDKRHFKGPDDKSLLLSTGERLYSLPTPTAPVIVAPPVAAAQTRVPTPIPQKLLDGLTVPHYIRFFKVPQDKVLVLTSGKRLRCLEDLSELLTSLEPDTYSFHVSKDKNDFADWIQNVFGETDLAERLRQYPAPAQMKLSVFGRVNKLNISETDLVNALPKSAKPYPVTPDPVNASDEAATGGLTPEEAQELKELKLIAPVLDAIVKEFDEALEDSDKDIANFLASVNIAPDKTASSIPVLKFTYYGVSRTFGMLSTYIFVDVKQKFPNGQSMQEYFKVIDPKNVFILYTSDDEEKLKSPTLCIKIPAKSVSVTKKSVDITYDYESTLGKTNRSGTKYYFKLVVNEWPKPPGYEAVIQVRDTASKTTCIGFRK